jgi:hypothetical protein
VGVGVMLAAPSRAAAALFSCACLRACGDIKIELVVNCAEGVRAD